MAKLWHVYTLEERADDDIPHAIKGCWIELPPEPGPNDEAMRQEQAKETARRVQLQIREDALSRRRYSLVVLGHGGHGKSTLVGHLLFQQGQITRRLIDRFEIDGKAFGKESSKYAWYSDQTAAERNSGTTQDCHWIGTEVTGAYVSLIDTPGAPHLVGRTIAGIAHADAALLVVSAENGEFERGIRKQGQISEHLNLVAKFGIKTLIVAVTAMDRVPAGEEEARFKDVMRDIDNKARKLGILPRASSDKAINLPNAVARNDGGPVFVPVSGLKGLNLLTPCANWGWYSGPTLSVLLDAVDSRALQRQQNRNDSFAVETLPGIAALRFLVLSVGAGANGAAEVIGRVVIGSLQPGDTVVTASGQISADVVGITRRGGNGVSGETTSPHIKMLDAVVGDIVTLALSKMPAGLRRGDVLSGEGTNAARIIRSFVARLTVLDHDNLTTGYAALLNVHGAEVPCRIGRVISRLNRRTFAVEVAAPPGLTNQEIGDVEVIPLEPVSLDPEATHGLMGLISIRYVPPEGAPSASGGDENDEPEAMRIVACGKVLSTVTK